RADHQHQRIIVAPQASEELLLDLEGRIAVRGAFVRAGERQDDLLHLRFRERHGYFANMVAPRVSAPSSSTAARRSAAHFANFNVTALRRLGCSCHSGDGRTMAPP